jgi:hypothetical protein
VAFPTAPECADTVSILWAVFRGAGQACVSVDTVSIVTALIPFVLGVVVLQWVARRLWAKATGPKTPTPQKAAKAGPFDTDYDGGPIKTTRGWR